MKTLILTTTTVAEQHTRHPPLHTHTHTHICKLYPVDARALEYLLTLIRLDSVPGFLEGISSTANAMA